MTDGAPAPTDGAPAPPPDSATARCRGPWWPFPALAALGLGLPLLVVWSVRYPAQVDAPNHLARHWLEALALRGEALPPGYEIAWRVLPNLGADLVLPPLILALGPLPAWKVFLSLSLALFWLGPAWFILRQGGYRPPARAAALLLLPFVLSTPFFWGFLNYYSGVGLAFLAAALLYRPRRPERIDAAALAVQTGLAALLYFWHLAAAVIYAALAGCLALHRFWTLWRAGQGGMASLLQVAPLGLPLLPLAVLHLAFSVGAEGSSALAWVRPPIKLLLVWLTLFEGYDTTATLAVWLFWAAALLAYFGPALRRSDDRSAGGRGGLNRPTRDADDRSAGGRGGLNRPTRDADDRSAGGRGGPDRAAQENTRRPGAARGSGAMALAAITFLALYLAMPWQWRAAGGADARLLPALLVCTLAWLGTLPAARWSWPGAALIAAAIVLRGGDVGQAWQRLDLRLREAALSLGQIGHRGRVLPVLPARVVTKEDLEEHFLGLAVITREAYVPTLFAAPDQQPLRLAGPPWIRLTRDEDGVLTLAEDPAAAGYDHLWVLNPQRVALRLPPGWEPRFAGERIGVWRLRPATETTPDATPR